MLKRQLFNQVLMPAVALALLCGVAIEAVSRPTPDDARPYHERVQRAVAAIPHKLGSWVGQDVPIPPSARAMLRPNALFSRRYENLDHGWQAALIIVQCETARDLRGHYPPICYPSHGLQMIDVKPMTWDMRGERVPGIEYHFNASTQDRAPHKVVANFMILPDGRIVRDMGAVESAAADYLRHFYGAAQVQIVMQSDLREDQRQRAVEQLISAIAPVIETIRMGGRPS